MLKFAKIIILLVSLLNSCLLLLLLVHELQFLVILIYSLPFIYKCFYKFPVIIKIIMKNVRVPCKFMLFNNPLIRKPINTAPLNIAVDTNGRKYSA